MFFVGRTPDFLCKGSLSLLEISTTSMLHFFLRDSHFPPAAQINLLLPEHPGHGWQWLCDRRAKRKESLEDGHSHKAPELSIQLPDLLFLESIHCSFKNKGPILWAAQWSILNSWSVFVYVQSQALPSAKTHHWHRTESQWRLPYHCVQLSHLKKGGGNRISAIVQFWEGPREERWCQAKEPKNSWGSRE